MVPQVLVVTPVKRVLLDPPDMQVLTVVKVLQVPLDPKALQVQTATSVPQVKLVLKVPLDQKVNPEKQGITEKRDQMDTKVKLVLPDLTVPMGRKDPRRLVRKVQQVLLVLLVRLVLMDTLVKEL